MTTAFVLSGGGSLGAVQVGMLQALAERGHTPDLLVGTSAGAINAAYVAWHGADLESLQTLATLWKKLRRREVFPLNVQRQLFAVLGRSPSAFSSDGLRALLERHLPYGALEDTPTPVHVVATDIHNGQEVLLSTGDAVSAVLASTAVPGLHPAVEREGMTLVDGGLANNAAISQAVTLGADRLYVLPTGFACALREPPRTAFAAALQALSFLTQQRLIHDVTAYDDRVDLRVLPPLCPLSVSPGDFTRADELIDRAHRAAGAWLDQARDQLPHPERYLSLHHHVAHPLNGSPASPYDRCAVTS